MAGPHSYDHLMDLDKVLASWKPPPLECPAVPLASRAM